MIQHHFKATKRPNQVYKPSPAVAEVYAQKGAVETAVKAEPEEAAPIELAEPTPVVQEHLHEVRHFWREWDGWLGCNLFLCVCVDAFVCVWLRQAVQYSRKGEQAMTPVEQKLVSLIQVTAVGE
jgi:hypothetical protein